MREILKDTDWQICEFIESKGAHFFGVVEKKTS
jgi:hypothetical protein